MSYTKSKPHVRCINTLTLLRDFQDKLPGQTSIFGAVFFVSKSPLKIDRQKKLQKIAILTRKPRSHVGILIYRAWPIETGSYCLHKHLKYFKQ